MNRDDYREYLRSEEWYNKRAAAIWRDGGRCRFCNSDENLNVHHRDYTHIPDETIDDLTTVCIECHRRLHGIGFTVDVENTITDLCSEMNDLVLRNVALEVAAERCKRCNAD